MGQILQEEVSADILCTVQETSVYSAAPPSFGADMYKHSHRLQIYVSSFSVAQKFWQGKDKSVCKNEPRGVLHSVNVKQQDP